MQPFKHHLSVLQISSNQQDEEIWNSACHVDIVMIESNSDRTVRCQSFTSELISFARDINSGPHTGDEIIASPRSFTTSTEPPSPSSRPMVSDPSENREAVPEKEMV